MKNQSKLKVNIIYDEFWNMRDTIDTEELSKIIKERYSPEFANALAYYPYIDKWDIPYILVRDWAVFLWLYSHGDKIVNIVTKKEIEENNRDGFVNINEKRIFKKLDKVYKEYCDMSEIRKQNDMWYKAINSIIRGFFDKKDINHIIIDRWKALIEFEYFDVTLYYDLDINNNTFKIFSYLIRFKITWSLDNSSWYDDIREYENKFRKISLVKNIIDKDIINKIQKFS